MVEYPAAFNANHTVKAFTDFLRDNADADIKYEHAILSSLMANLGTGRVILSSCNGIKENRRMDWEFIKRSLP